MEDNQYSNPVLEHYECDGQMDIFDFLDCLDESVAAKEKDLEKKQNLQEGGLLYEQKNENL